MVLSKSRKSCCRRTKFVVAFLMVLTNNWISCAFQNDEASHSRARALRPMGSRLLQPGSVRQSHVRGKDFNRLHQTQYSTDEFADERRRGLLVLVTVPMAWGSFEPAVRYVYEIQSEMPPFVFSFLYYLTAATTLTLLAARPLSKKDGDLCEIDAVEDYRTNKAANKSVSLVQDLLSVQGGIELGTYLFVGNGFQVVGLKTVPSDRAAFLLQLTTIFVPLVQSVVARNLQAVSCKTWLACLIALSGVAFIGLDGSNDNSLSSLSLQSFKFTSGDLYIVVGALFYTFHCIRLEGYAKSTSAINLAATKATTETTWCAMVVLFCIFAATSNSLDLPQLDFAKESGRSILEYKDSLLDCFECQGTNQGEWFKLTAITLWTGLVPVAYTIYAQSFGQSRVPPATANLIYTIQPFFTALIAFCFLGEALGLAGYIGGILIGSAVLLVIQEDAVTSPLNTNKDTPVS